MKEYIAHVRVDNHCQSNEEHLIGTADLASQFAADFQCENWGALLGLWHDIGKYSNVFQNYIRISAGIIEDAELSGKVDHSSAGAIYAVKRLPQLGLPLAYCIAGHHAGLLNWCNEPGISGNLESRLQKDSINQIPVSIIEQLNKLDKSLTLPFRFSEGDIHMWIRMLFSCLVDADYMDTERFMQPDNYIKRAGFDSLVTLKQRFDSFMESLSSSAQPSLINIKRREVLDKCRKAGLLHQGIFNLTVPTGGGKTLSSLAFALEHAIKYDKKRIIVAIPYTSIITQTAQVFRNIFGNDNVVEHHSNLDGDTLSAKQKLATENWDAPIIVTTNVQLFESLYSNRSSHCRKLHNLSHSILILDEAQMLPIEFLKPILSSLNTLVELFDVTLLCTTATQPVLSGKIGSREAMFTGFKREVTDIVTNAAELTKDFKRVTIELPEEINTVTFFDEIAEELKKHEQVLCIVNTRKESQNLYSKMPETTLHLSRMMCSAHILDTIKVIKEKLLNNQPVRVISTQLIEAGVDIDFPIVYRAFAGLDSIAQAAGRCNREGHLNKKGLLGKVKVFNSEKGIPPGYMRKSAGVLKELLLIDKHIDLLSPLTMTKYFEGAFSKVNNFDKPDIKDLLWKDERNMKFQFATAARDFKLIDDAGSKSFVVRYNEGADYIEMLKNKGPESWLMRKLQHYTVSVREADFKELVKYGHIECFYGIWVQTDSNLYNSKAGVVLSDQWISEVFIL